MLERSVHALTTLLAGQYVTLKKENETRELQAQMAEMKEISEDKENKHNQDLEQLYQKIERDKQEAQEKAEKRTKLQQAETETMSKQLQLLKSQAAEKEKVMQEQLRNQSDMLLNLHEKNSRRHESELQKQLLEVQGQRDQEMRVKEEMKAEWEEKEKLLRKDLTDLQMKHKSEVEAEQDRHADMKRKMQQELQEKHANEISSIAKDHQMQKKKWEDQIQVSKEKRDQERFEESKEVISTQKEFEKVQNSSSKIKKWFRKTFDPELVKSLQQSSEALQRLRKKYEDENAADTMG